MAIYLNSRAVVVQVKPRANLGVEKKKEQIDKEKGGDLFIVGPWVKKAGGADLESGRLENS